MNKHSPCPPGALTYLFSNATVLEVVELARVCRRIFHFLHVDNHLATVECGRRTQSSPPPFPVSGEVHTDGRRSSHRICGVLTVGLEAFQTPVDAMQSTGVLLTRSTPMALNQMTLGRPRRLEQRNLQLHLVVGGVAVSVHVIPISAALATEATAATEAANPLFPSAGHEGESAANAFGHCGMGEEKKRTSGWSSVALILYQDGD